MGAENHAKGTQDDFNTNLKLLFIMLLILSFVIINHILIRTMVGSRLQEVGVVNQPINAWEVQGKQRPQRNTGSDCILLSPFL